MIAAAQQRRCSVRLHLLGGGQLIRWLHQLWVQAHRPAAAPLRRAPSRGRVPHHPPPRVLCSRLLLLLLALVPVLLLR
jgi:hypothetical protein